MKAAAASAAGVPTPAELREAVDIIRAEKLPETADGREKYFASNLATAEQLGLQSESPVEHSSTHAHPFFRLVFQTRSSLQRHACTAQCVSILSQLN